jgi:hypothetical protein
LAGFEADGEIRHISNLSLDILGRVKDLSWTPQNTLLGVVYNYGGGGQIVEWEQDGRFLNKVSVPGMPRQARSNASGQWFVAGLFEENFVWGQVEHTARGNNDFFFLGIDPSGQEPLLFAYVFGTDFDDDPYSLPWAIVQSSAAAPALGLNKDGKPLVAAGFTGTMHIANQEITCPKEGCVLVVTWDSNTSGPSYNLLDVPSVRGAFSIGPHPDQGWSLGLDWRDANDSLGFTYESWKLTLDNNLHISKQMRLGGGTQGTHLHGLQFEDQRLAMFGSITLEGQVGGMNLTTDDQLFSGVYLYQSSF